MCSGDAAVWVFTRSGSTWREDQKLAGSREEFDSFGTSVALSGKGDTALISGYTDGRGSVWVFGRSGSTWTVRESLTRRGRNYGYGLGGGPYLIVRVSADADTALVSGGGEGKEGQLPVWVFHALGFDLEQRREARRRRR